MKTRVTLDEELAKLSPEIEPPRDLWPGVVRGIVRTPRSAPRLSAVPWMAYAASAAGLCLAAALAWVMVQGHPPLTASAPGTSSGPPSTANQAVQLSPTAGTASSGGVGESLGEPSDPHYLAARAELEQTFNQRLAQLDPATRAKIEADLASIRKARDDIRKALEAQPDSPVLEQLLASALHDELDLYDDVVRTTQPTSARI
ncbi:MAG: hypothetical protein ABSD02_07045 [Steroidobacteraceae bacterium]|jgi:hypothetical protein